MADSRSQRADDANWKRDPKTWAAIAVTLLLWASAFAAIRAGMRLTPAGVPGPDGYGPGQVALLRFGTASIVLAVYALVTRMRLPDRNDLPRIAVAGVFGITLYHVALNFGEVTVNAGAASLLIASGPVFTALMAVAFLGERLKPVGWIGIAIAFTGVALISMSGRGGLHFSAGALLILFSAIATSVYFVISKEPLRRYSSVQFTSYVIWAGTIPMLVFLPGLVSQLPTAAPSATLAVIYLGVFPAAIAYVLWSYALARMPASLLTSFLYLSPVLAMLIAWVWLGEVQQVLTLVGGAIAILGVVIVQSWGQARRPALSLAENPIEASDA
jgi:drug/metabolite transporter (DMT)-like permease